MSETQTPLVQVVEASSQSAGATEVAGRPIGRRRSDRIVGASENSQQVTDGIATAARAQHQALIAGPAGSGKRHVARAIHTLSGRAAGPLVIAAVAGLPEAQAREEIFGAVDGGGGALAAAADGTLVIHRIDALAPTLRSAIVDAIRRGSYSPGGVVDGSSSPIRARVLATSESAEASLFGDLPTQVLAIAPLHERPEDILPLAAHFLAEFAQEAGVPPVGFTNDARRLLIEEQWRANVRELRERVRGAVALAGQGAISAEALMLAMDGEDVPSFKEAKRAFETRYVEGLLRRCGGNISRAARLAKKDRKDFYDVIRRTGVDPQEFRA